MVNDSLAQIAQAAAAIGPPRTTARHLVDASVSANTRRSYAGALRRLDAWLDGRPLGDPAGSSPATAGPPAPDGSVWQASSPAAVRRLPT